MNSLVKQWKDKTVNVRNMADADNAKKADAVMEHPPDVDRVLRSGVWRNLIVGVVRMIMFRRVRLAGTYETSQP